MIKAAVLRSKNHCLDSPKLVEDIFWKSYSLICNNALGEKHPHIIPCSNFSKEFLAPYTDSARPVEQVRYS